MNSEEIRGKFIDFFIKRGHRQIPSARLLSEDPTLLFVSAGMVPLKPYILGAASPPSKRLVNCQKSFRTVDMEKVGTNDRSLTFFEMLGNWSIGDYWKKETINYAWEFLIKELKINPSKLWVTIFKGDNEISFDEETKRIWLEKGIGAEKIVSLGRDDNFWIAGDAGPCGPCTEIYYDRGKRRGERVGCKDKNCKPGCECDRFLEIWNLVFMEYNKTPDGSYEKLALRTVDTGAGLERLALVVQNVENVFETDIFQPLMLKINDLAPNLEEKAKKILADHLRASIFLIADSVRPSNKEAGYVLRRLLRRILAYQIKYDIHADLFPGNVEIIKEKFGKIYPEVKETKIILEVLEEERQKFQEAIAQGMRKIDELNQKSVQLTGQLAFDLYQTYGLPLEISQELIRNKTAHFKQDFDKEFEKHQEISRAGAKKKFGGHGLLLNTGELKVIRLHTATHLLHWALREVLDGDVRQMGSDINSERLRFDFSFNRKMTSEEVKKIENLVNQKIKEDLPVYFKEMPKVEAEKTGALHFFKQKYPEIVKVYFIGPISAEFCAGPHVEKTSEIGEFKILKEEALGAGLRRIRAEIEF